MEHRGQDFRRAGCGRLLRGLLPLLLIVPAYAARGGGAEVRREQIDRGAAFRLAIVPPPHDAGLKVVSVRYDPELAQREDTGVYESETMRVEWPVALGPSGRLLAARLDYALRSQTAGWGIPIPRKLLLQLRPVAEWPSVLVLQSRWETPDVSPYLPLPLPVLAEGAPWSERLAGVTLPSNAVFVMMHEVMEFLLVTRVRGTLLMDVGTEGGEVEAHYTRWFREGYANVTATSICDQLGLGSPFTRRQGTLALEATGARLLFWTQGPGLTPAQTARFYQASFEAVSRMAEVRGRAGMAELLESFNQYDYLDGKRLGGVTAAVLGHRPREFLSGGIEVPPGGGDGGRGSVRPVH